MYVTPNETHNCFLQTPTFSTDGDGDDDDDLFTLRGTALYCVLRTVPYIKRRNRLGRPGWGLSLRGRSSEL